MSARQQRVAWTTCPWCLRGQDGVTYLTGKRPPHDGDVSLCAYCAELSVFDAAALNGRRKPTVDEEAEINADPTVVRAQSVLRNIHRRIGQPK